MTFWALVVTMTITAIATIAVPVGGLARKPLQNSVPSNFDEQRRPYHRTRAILAAIFIPSISLSLYAYLGSPDYVTSTSKPLHDAQFASSNVAGRPSVITVASVASLVGGLRERLEREPNDSNGWLLLARSYDHLGRYAEATAAYDHASALGKSDITLEQSLESRSVAEGESANVLVPSLRGRVTLTTEAAALVSAHDTVFIFAKQSPSHRMPVAALRKPASELPIDFVLSDEQAMVPGTHLSDFQSLVVSARVSRSGLATDVVNGLEVWSDPISMVDGREIHLLIAADNESGNSSNE